MSEKYTVTVSADASEPVVSYTGTLEELVYWGYGYLADPTSLVLDLRCNPFNNDLYTIEAAVNPVTGEMVQGHRWFNDGYGDNPAHPAFEDPHAIKAVEAEIFTDITTGELEIDEIPEREYIILHPEPLAFTYENVLEYLKYTCGDVQHVVTLEPAS